MEDLVRLADLIRARTAIDNEIAALLGRPAQIGHAGEYIAARVFGIRLQESASHKGIDGYFAEGPLAGRSVNVKWYGKHESILDINPDAPCDYFLVMTGPRATLMTSRGGTRPWVISHVYLFEMPPLIAVLQARGVRIGVATGVRAEDWRQAEIYPSSNNPLIVLSEEQRCLLALFSPPPA